MNDLAGLFEDVAPVPQADAPNPVASIAYSQEFTDVMSYFRAMLLADERSERALKLSQRAIQLNPANYTAWHFRFLCVQALGFTSERFREELLFVEEIADESAKNYQLWHHRKGVIGLMGESVDVDAELRFTASILQDDDKNYHTWGYRQWVVSTFGKWEEELEFTQTRIELDFRNNSAWNQRFWVLQQTNALQDAAKLQSEIEFAFAILNLAPKNESPWNYLRGLVRHGGGDPAAVLAKCSEVRKAYPAALPAFAFEADVLALSDPLTPDIKAKAAELYTHLAQADLVRRAYWESLATEMQA